MTRSRADVVKIVDRAPDGRLPSQTEAAGCRFCRTCLSRHRYCTLDAGSVDGFDRALAHEPSRGRGGDNGRSDDEEHRRVAAGLVAWIVVATVGNVAFRSVMPDYPDMTLGELADVVSYLQTLRSGKSNDIYAIRRPDSCDPTCPKTSNE